MTNQKSSQDEDQTEISEKSKKKYNKVFKDDLEDFIEVWGYIPKEDFRATIEASNFELLHMARLFGWKDVKVQEKMFKIFKSLEIDICPEDFDENDDSSDNLENGETKTEP